MNIYNVLDKLKAIAEKDPHYRDAAKNTEAYGFKTVSEGVHGETCNECGMYESHCECPEEEVMEGDKPDFLDLDKDGNKKESMKKAAADKKSVKESPELRGILKHAGIAMITPSGTMANQADNLVESINRTKSILNENYSGGLNLTPVAEVGYSAKKASAGQDIGKPGKNFSKIAKSAGERYGSKKAGERVAGAVLAKLRAKESVGEADMKESGIRDDLAYEIKMILNGALGGTNQTDHIIDELGDIYYDIEDSGDEIAMTAYSMMNDAIDEDIKVQIQMARNALRLLKGKAVNEAGQVTDPQSNDEMGAYDPPLGEANVNVPDTGDMGRNRAGVTIGEEEKTHKGGTVTKTATGIKHKAKEIDWENEKDEESDEQRGRGRPKKKEAEKVSASLPWGGKPPKASQYKLPKHKGTTWGMKGGEKFSRAVNEGIAAANMMIVESYPSWKREIRAAYPGVAFTGNAVKCQALVEGVEVAAFAAPMTEKAPPGDKYERMVKHIKQGYAKDGKLTPQEKSIAYATAWKKKNADMDEGVLSGKDLPWQEPGDPTLTKTMTQDYKKDIKEPGQRVLQRAKDMALNLPVKEQDLDEVSKGEYLKQQDAAAEKAGKDSFKAFGQDFSTKEIDETIAVLERMKALAGMPVKEESDAEKDDKAEKAAEKVAKDVEYDDKRDHDKTDAEKRDDDAEEDGEEVKKDIEYDDKKDSEEKDEDKDKDDKEEKVDEAEESKSSGGYYGKGVYESFESQFQQMVAEDITVSTNQSSAGDDTVTVTATQDDAQSLVELLKMAGMGREMYQKYDPSTCAEEAVTEENSGNTADATEYGDVDELVNRLSGGLNGMKLQYAKGYKGDNDITTLKGQAG